MKFLAEILSEEEKHLIHSQSLRILSEIGVKCHGRTALPLLKKHGAIIDQASEIAKIPIELVEAALHSAPRSVLLGGRNPKYSYSLPSKQTRYGMDGTGAFMADFTSGERRYGLTKDIYDGLRVFQEADMGVLAWPPVCASDTPAHSRPLHEFFTMMKATSKHGQHEIHAVEQVPYLLEGLEVMAGSEEEISRKNLYSLIYCPVAPLVHDGPMLDAYLQLGEAGVPVMIMPMPVNGTTGPASLYSNIALANAETLSAIVIFQLAHPGRPIIYSSATGSVDFRTGAYLAGTAEMGLQSAALVKMGRFYELPSTSAGMTTDAKEPGAEAVLEKVITTQPGVQAGSDIIVGFGEVDSDQVLHLEQILVDNEIAHFCERLQQGIDVTSKKDLFEDIKHVGPGGHFLASKNTRDAARSEEFYKGRLSNRQPYETWLDLGKPTMYPAARKKVEEILACPNVDALPDELAVKLDDILRRADRELE